MSLRTKFSLFVSLVIILVCSGLSAYLIQQETERMKGTLLNSGTTLVKTLSRVSTNRLIVQDTAYLNTILESALASSDVLYAVVTDEQGTILAAKSKGLLIHHETLLRNEDLQLLPDEQILKDRLTKSVTPLRTEPWISVLHSSETNRNVLRLIQTDDAQFGKKGLFTETIYDFIQPIYRLPARSTTFELLSSESLAEPSQTRYRPSSIIGAIQVGLTTAPMQQTLQNTVQRIGLITVGFIILGILLTVVLANRIVTPLRRLAGTAEKIASGNLDIALTPDSEDEVGQLTATLNQMADSLHQRETSITTYVHTITKQITQLSALHQTSTAIAGSLEIQKHLDGVLKSLRQNLGFQRMVLVRYDAIHDQGIVSELAGISKELEEKIRGMTFPLIKGDSMDTHILVEGKPALVRDLEEIADRMNPLVLPILRSIKVQSFVVAPLISHQNILGYLGADKGDEYSTQEDLDLLVTVAGYVAVALDNARAYENLENLAQTLEQRVTERTHELQTANERLQELDRLKSAFVSIVSHELRTPMTSIKGLVENMLDGLTGPTSERQAFYLSRVKHNIERLTRMINDLLDLSRIEAGRLELHPSQVNLGSLAREVVELFQPTAQEQSLSLQTRIADSLPLISGDRDKLVQVITNLVNNAVKFTDPPGTITVSVSRQGDGWVQVCVADTGCGISEEDQRTLFEPFYRSQTAPQKMSGAGLGLAISKSLIELHGGRIWAESTVGQGSRFCFCLPISAQLPKKTAVELPAPPPSN